MQHLSLKYIPRTTRATQRDQYHATTGHTDFYSRFERNWSKLRACLPSVLYRVRVWSCTCVT